MDRADDRTRLAIMLAGQCGLRRGEIARAQREDVERDLSGWSLRVTGKGGHERIVPLPDALAETILSRPAGWLFPSPAGGHLTPHWLGRTISDALGSGLTTHTLRHRAGTTAYAGTHDLRAVQEMLGHSKPETTACYVAIPDSAIRAAVAAAAA
jgi:integrase